ncbi:glycoside hydrolase family 25 protein [Pseudomonas sp. LB3P38]|uniref:glycoside hydrolase family 25 protein n=1 Tax=Pseudomonas lyxosi TaxID=3398358 RepID=UPI0039F0E30C
MLEEPYAKKSNDALFSGVLLNYFGKSINVKENNRFFKKEKYLQKNSRSLSRELLVELFACLVLLQFSTGSYAECSRPLAPGKFEFHQSSLSKTGYPTNDGIIPRGFVSLADNTPVVHGVDVSKYQDELNFDKAKKCGAMFAYVRLSGGSSEKNETLYRVHWANARSAGLYVGPYHNLSIIPEEIKHLKAASIDERPAIIKDLMGPALESARSQASLFISKLDEVLELDPRPDPLTGSEAPTYLRSVIDATTDPLAEATLLEKQQLSPLYESMVCEWINTLQKSKYTSKVILFTTPYVYATYLDHGTACDLSKTSIWIRWRNDDGDKFDREKDPIKLAKVSELCGSEKTNRCILHQYTSFGGFGVYEKDAPIDLNRFYGTELEMKELFSK